MIPTPLQQLMQTMAKLPGLGPRSAQRAVLALLQDSEKYGRLLRELQVVKDEVVTCKICGNLGLHDPCHICEDTRRDHSTICVVEGVDDLWALERSGAFRGQYHVLGGVVSALDGVAPEDLRMGELVARLEKGGVNEVIIALAASVDGQTTAHLLAKKLREAQPDINITTPAKGMPVGAGVDYLDDGTLNLALQGRQNFN